MICHNDVCLENVVFRHGEAVALLDFDFAAPGRMVYDLACFSSHVCADRRPRQQRPAGLADQPICRSGCGLVADEYGLDEIERGDLLVELHGTIVRGGQFMLRRVEAGDQNFIELWNSIGGMERFDRRRRWWAERSRASNWPCGD